jgi:hypothetical protein
MPDESSTPTLAPPPPSAPTPPAAAVPPPPAGKSSFRTVMESVVDLTAILVVGALAWYGKANSEFALGLIALLAGVRITDVVGTRGGPPSPPTAGGGAALGSVAGAFLALGAGVVEALRRGGHHAQ